MHVPFRISYLTLCIIGVFIDSSCRQQAFAQSVVVDLATPAGQLAAEKKADKNANPDQLNAAQKRAKNTEQTKSDTIQKVIIDGGRSDDDARRQSTAAKLIFGREELDRNGDTNLGEVLKRLPGVTIGGKPGRGGDIRMRGMGNGYTQILINGERAPRGFSMDSLSPDQVERIEVIRGAVAEYSTQAIAGTINIVLREDYKQKNIELKASLSSEQNRLAPNVSVSYPGEIANITYALNATVFQNRQRDQSTTNSVETAGDGSTNLLQNEYDETHRHTTGIVLTPRFNYKFENGDTLMFQPFVMHSESISDGVSLVDQIYRAPNAIEPPAYAVANSSGSADTTFSRFFGNWQHKFENSAKLAVRFGGGYGKMDSSSVSNEFDTNGVPVAVVSVTNTTVDKTLNNGGKYTRPIGEKQTFAAGWELELGQRNQTSISLSNGKPQFQDSGDDLSASSKRFALFVQDEADITSQFSAYVGMRWEGIKTTSTLAGLDVGNTSSVWSPIAHAVWRLPGDSKDQIRFSYATTYRAPALNDLIAIPSISNLNSPTRPDRIGNPLLKPELSKGIDVAFEHYLSSAGLLSANFFIRDISDLMRRTTQLVSGPTGQRWVSSPVNIGSATTKGVELEAKFQLQEFFPAGPAIDFRSNYSRFWSNVEDIQGPYNKIDQQPPYAANAGLDYRVKGLPLTLGGNLNITPGYFTQGTDTQLNLTGLKRQIDFYGLWKFKPDLQLRVSANNFRANNYVSSTDVSLGGVNRLDYVTNKTYTTLSIRLEMKL
ncbi:TonB-dependent receptor plug domain-containing protein [Undibacterium sp. RuRC25W]|uniref:TonB-dependent receptor plug domain-containing protein n=1 Tax=Undibacterium sp. RuRC25W TaxID=3413047 RepID=UPI003BF0E1E8